MKKRLAGLLALVMMAGCAGCGKQEAAGPKNENPPAKAVENTVTQSSESASPENVITVKVASEYSRTEPIGQALDQWARLVEERGDGSLKIVVYPDSQLGGKTDIIDALLMGEPDIVGADPAFMAEYGVPDLGILFGPFLFDNRDQCALLTESEWYKDQCRKLEEKGLKVIDSTWITGVRHLLTNKPVQSPEDIKGMKIRVPANQIQTESFNVLGASATAMNLSEVYTALQTGTIDGGENPLSTLYNRKFQEVSKYLLKTGHVRVISMWTMSAEVWNKLTPQQQELMTSTLAEVGEEFNIQQEQADEEYEEKFKEEGVTVVELSDTERQQWIDASQPFYDKGSSFGWSDGLYDQVQSAIGK